MSALDLSSNSVEVTMRLRLNATLVLGLACATLPAGSATADPDVLQC